MSAPAILNLSTAELLTMDDVGTILRVKDLARRAVHHGWLTPCARSADGGSGSWLFSKESVDSLIARIKQGEVPPALPRKKDTQPE